MAYTLEDFIKLNPQYKKRYDPTNRMGYVSNIGSGKEISFGLGAGQKYGLGGVEGGSHTITDPGKLISALSKPTQSPYQSPYSEQIGQTLAAIQNKPQPTQSPYQSPYGEQIGQTLAAIQNRPAFSYNPASDVGLQTAQGTAMDAVSRAAARRGMLYSASNKSQMGESALKLVPQFEETAYNRYAQQSQDTYSQLQALQTMENSAYGRYRDTVGDIRYQGEDVYQQLAALSGLEKETYGRYRDTVGDVRYEDELTYERQRQTTQDLLAIEESKLTAQQKELDQAWDRVKNLGYVDPVASETLGLPVGTSSFEAQKAYDELSVKLQITKDNNTAAMQRVQTQQAGANARAKLGAATSQAKTTQTERINQAKGEAFGSVIEALNNRTPIETILRSINAQAGSLMAAGVDPEEIKEYALNYSSDEEEIKGIVEKKIKNTEKTRLQARPLWQKAIDILPGGQYR